LGEEAEPGRAAGMNFPGPKPGDWPQLFSAMGGLVAEHEGLKPTPAGAPTESHADRGDGLVLDRTKLFDLCDRIGEANAADLLRMLEMEAKERFVLRSEEESRSSRAIADDAHGLAGAAAMLGFDELVCACRALEASANAGEDVAAALTRCRTACDRAFSALAHLKEEGTTPDRVRKTA